MNDTKRYLNKANKFVQSNGSGKNTPVQYNDRGKQYLSSRTAKYTAERAYLASDYVKAEAQGLSPDNFYAWQTVRIRMPVALTTTPTSTTHSDDYKRVLMTDLNVDYFPIGAKLKAMGNTWICVNPSNMSTVNPTCIVARCNASYNIYDEYGNIHTEPLVIKSYEMHANSNESPLNEVVMDGNFKVICQLNDVTRKLGINQRIILGTYPYVITGYTDFIQEFSKNRESSHILTFSVHLEEPTESDDMINYVANGNTQTFSAEMSGNGAITNGQQAQFTAYFIRNGQTVSSDDAYPPLWIWESSDDSVASVDNNGTVTAKAVGNAVISVSLKQNPNITAETAIEVSSSDKTVSGYPLILTNAVGGALENVKIYGNTVQDGIPAPDNSAEIKSVGDLITDTASAYYGKYRIRLKATNGTDIKIADIYLSEPLRKVGSAVDYIDFTNGRVVRNVKKYKFSDCTEIDYYSNRITPESWRTTVVALRFRDKKATGSYDVSSQNSICNYFKNVGPSYAYTQARAVNGTYSDHPTFPNIYIDIGNKNDLYTPSNPITNWVNWDSAYIVSATEDIRYEDVSLPDLIITGGKEVIITAETEIKPSAISADYDKGYIEFSGAVPKEIEQYKTANLSVACFINGAEIDKPYAWSFGGADSSCYDAKISADGKTAKITCLASSDIPLTVTAGCAGMKISTDISLYGY